MGMGEVFVLMRKQGMEIVTNMGIILHRHTVKELGWGLNPHCTSSLLPSSFFPLPSL